MRLTRRDIAGRIQATKHEFDTPVCGEHLRQFPTDPPNACGDLSSPFVLPDNTEGRAHDSPVTASACSAQDIHTPVHPRLVCQQPWAVGGRLSPQVLKVDFVGYSVKVSRRIAVKSRFNVANSPDDTIDRLIREIFRAKTTATDEYLDEPSSNLFVLIGGGLRVRIKPAQQSVKRFLCQNPVFFHSH